MIMWQQIFVNDGEVNTILNEEVKMISQATSLQFQDSKMVSALYEDDIV